MTLDMKILPIHHRIDLDAGTGCWLYNGFTDRDGYGKWTSPRPNRKCWFVHRLAYTLLVGSIAPGLTLDHLCRVRACCNPDHLEPVSSRVNTLRGVGPSAVNARRRACVNGHDLRGPNVVLKAGPHGMERVCRTCRNSQALARYHRLRSERSVNA